MENKKIKIQLYGKFRSYIPDGFFHLEVASDLQISVLKKEIKDYLKNNVTEFEEMTLVDDSAIADEQMILCDSDQVGIRNRFSILPPVCGG